MVITLDKLNLSFSHLLQFIQQQKSLIKLSLLALCISVSSGCVSTAIGLTVGTAVAVTKVAVKAPIKVGGAVVDAVISDEDEKSK